MQVWSKSIHLFRRYCVGKPNLISFHGLLTLKMRSRSPKSNQLFPPPNHVSMQVWSKSIHWFKRYRVGKKLRGRRRQRDPHQKQYVLHLRLGGHNFYISPCLFIVFENFRIRFVLHAKNESFLHKRSSDVISTVLVQLKVNLQHMLGFWCFFPEIMLDLVSIFHHHNLFC